MQNRNDDLNNQDYNNNHRGFYNSPPGAYGTYPGMTRQQIGTRRGKVNNTLLVMTLCISIVAIVVCVAAVFLLVTNGDTNQANNNGTVNVSQNPALEEPEKEEPKQEEPPKETKPQPIPAGYNMYVTANDYLVLRSGPSVNYSEITRMYYGDVVYVIEYVTDTFARVNYNGIQGYASRHYLSGTKPQPVYQWNYTEYEVEAFVAASLNWYVNAVSSGDISGAEHYFKGSILQTEKNNAKRMAGSVARETLLGVSCSNFKRISPTRVSVTRSSDIEIVEWNGSSRVARESRVYVLENTGSGMYIIDIHK